MTKKNRRILRQAASVSVMKRFFKKKLPYLYPKAKLISFKLDDQSEYKFKKSVRYTLELLYPNGEKVEKIIRGNVPSIHQPWEIKNSDESLKYLYLHGFNQGLFQVSRPLGHYPKRRLQLYEECPGEIFTSLIQKRKKGIEKNVLLASTWVAKFHNLKAKIGQPKTISRIKQEINYFLKSYKGYSENCYQTGKKILNLFFKNFKKSYHPQKYYLIHGDLNSNNIIINKNTVGVIDFGNAWRFDPLCDVANFLVQLELLAWQKRASAKFVQKINSFFLKNYLKKTNQNTKSAQKMINLWRVWWLMQITAFGVSILVDTKKNRRALEKTVIKHTLPEAKWIFGLKD